MNNKLVQVVDPSNKLIGYKKREEINPRTDIYRVSALWLTNTNGQVLLAQRKLTKLNDPGKWGPAVAGTLEGDETFDSNIIKEIKEEIGLDDLKVVQGPLIRINKPNNYFCQLYRSTSDKSIAEFNLQKEEVEQLKWFDYDVLKKEYQKQPDNFVPIISKILDLII